VEVDRGWKNGEVFIRKEGRVKGKVIGEKEVVEEEGVLEKM